MFIKKKEDFVCGHCGRRAEGDGYTNHCPGCLWSRHVDVSPGDRNEGCGGMMEPVRVAHTGGEYVIVHRCVACRMERRNKAGPHDNFEALLALC